MMGERTGMLEALFYEFSLEQHVPERHMMRLIDRFVDLTAVRKHLQRTCHAEISLTGRVSALRVRLLRNP